MALSESDIDRISQRIVSSLESAHVCKLSVGERKMLHGMYDTMIQEDANQGTWRIIIQSGVAMQSTMKKISLAFMVSLIMIVFSFAGAKGVSWIEKFLK